MRAHTTTRFMESLSFAERPTDLLWMVGESTWLTVLTFGAVHVLLLSCFGFNLIGEVFEDDRRAVVAAEAAVALAAAIGVWTALRRNR